MLKLKVLKCFKKFLNLSLFFVFKKDIQTNQQKIATKISNSVIFRASNPRETELYSNLFVLLILTVSHGSIIALCTGVSNDISLGIF